jgi:adenine-specific DNA-methyltransferase
MALEKFGPGDDTAKSKDVISANIGELQRLFPELITEGPEGAAVNVDVLKTLVGDQTVTDADEKFGLNWHGKRQARQLALTPSTGTLRPCPEDSVDWDTTQNLMIEGDNLEVLKLLKKSYAGKVKLIYIDPPYNTGKDFVYKDNYRDNIKNYLEQTGQTGEEGETLTSNTEASGRYHTDWLNMMYPRLKLARELLRDDGMICIHIDEHEYPNLLKLLEEEFGESAQLGTIVWDKRNPKGEVIGVAQQHELIPIYCKSKAAFAEADYLTRKKESAEAMLAFVAEQLVVHGGMTDQVRSALKDWIKNSADKLTGGEKAYSLIDERGDIYRGVSMAAPDRPETRSHRALVHPTTGKNCPVPSKGWRYTDPSIDELLRNELVLFGADETTQPTRKYRLKDNLRENLPSLLYFGGSGEALGIPFPNPKPLAVAARFVEPLKVEEEIVLDFFAGSGTTGHAVMAQNADDGGTRKFILVQLPEPLDPEVSEQKAAADLCDDLGVPRNIAELTKERLRRAGKKVAAEHPDYKGDLGFRVFKLDSSNIRTWDPHPDDLAATLEEGADHVKPDRSNDDVLYEILLKLGIDLCVPIETHDIAGKPVQSVGGGALIACLTDTITTEDAEPLATGIAQWHNELAPAGDTTCIFRDNAFQNDVAKTNLAAILEQHGITTTRSI